MAKKERRRTPGELPQHGKRLQRRRPLILPVEKGALLSNTTQRANPRTPLRVIHRRRPREAYLYTLNTLPPWHSPILPQRLTLRPHQRKRCILGCISRCFGHGSLGGCPCPRPPSWICCSSSRHTCTPVLRAVPRRGCLGCCLLVAARVAFGQTPPLLRVRNFAHASRAAGPISVPWCPGQT